MVCLPRFMPVIVLVAAAAAVAQARGEDAPNAGALALLEEHCVSCHNAEKTKGGLDLTTRDALLRGGETGAAVSPGKWGESFLLQTLRHEADPHMPHKKPKLAAEEIKQLETWVASGAPYDRT